MSHFLKNLTISQSLEAINSKEVLEVKIYGRYNPTDVPNLRSRIIEAEGSEYQCLVGKNRCLQISSVIRSNSCNCTGQNYLIL